MWPRNRDIASSGQDMLRVCRPKAGESGTGAEIHLPSAAMIRTQLRMP